MKPHQKAFLFLLILWVCDLLFRKGFIAFIVPVSLPQHLGSVVMYTIFAALALWLTSKFASSDKLSLSSLGVSFSKANTNDFLVGFGVGVILWAIVSVAQSLSAGFSWEWNEQVSISGLLFGLIFIFIADLGTELFTRAYPLVQLKNRYGYLLAIAIMVVFVGLKSYSFEASGELLTYIILIPALHTIFFSIIYFKTKRLGAALGIHTGANFVTISVFDLRPAQVGQLIPSGLLKPDTNIETLSLHALQLPWVGMAIAFSAVVYFWRKKA
ncbi:CPBP family glutamic-type intramembrane protease [Jiulongibacter sp. NS-SX5]|uniref:CPBP family glutamic-type intramembrane protease n=1 Tax=Jiulongibacter sp. NS-SX5 TaxID=3463854 RepID=UPI0040591153